MLKFAVFDQGKPAEEWPIRNAYLIGSDYNAIRADIRFNSGLIICQKREPSAAALALQHPVDACGELTIQTCLLPERDEPYVLTVELARHRLMLLYTKLEEWAMFDICEDHQVGRRLDQARDLFIEALAIQEEDPAAASRLAQQSLVTSIDGSEELALAHAELLLGRRRSTGAMPRYAVGCGVALDHASDSVRASLQANFDYIHLPTPWRAIMPTEGEQRWEVLDNWTQWLSRVQVPALAGPLISFEPVTLPDWLYIWEHDYETVRDMVYEHVGRVVGRYKSTVNVWNVISGLHVNSHFPFSFDQIIDLTRMAAMQVKSVQPNGKVLIEIRQPFGEYYSRNQRSIPPLMYMDLLIQNAIKFDGFLVRLLIGQAQSGQYTRDLMQISALLDQYAGFNRPIHLRVGVPSEPVTEAMITAPESGEAVDPNCGIWRKQWSPQVQSHWAAAVVQIALSKPFVESIAWDELIDHPDIELPLSGLIDENLASKGAFRQMTELRRGLQLTEATAEEKA